MGFRWLHPINTIHHRCDSCGRKQSAGFLGDERLRVTSRETSLVAGEAQPIGAHSINWKVFLSNDDVFGVSKTDRKI